MYYGVHKEGRDWFCHFHNSIHHLVSVLSVDKLTEFRKRHRVKYTFIYAKLTSLSIHFSLGELDPERIGSGIQYGDTSTRRLHREKNRRQPDCMCRM